MSKSGSKNIDNKSVLFADNIDLTGAASSSGMLVSDGQLIIGNSLGNPQSNTLTAGTGISITNGSGNITISSSGGGINWVEITSVTTTLLINTGHVMNRATSITATLPTTAALGSLIKLAGKGVGLMHISQNAGQQIHFGSASTTSGVGGSMDSTNRYDALELVCITANTTWLVLSSIGSWTIT